MTGPGRVFVCGASGVMGRRIVALLRETLPSGSVVNVARTSGTRADVSKPESLPLRPGDVIIDAVGPYQHDPTAIVSHCLRSGAHYLDLCEVPEFNNLVRAAVADFARHEAVSSAVVTGCSTVPAMVDVLVPPRPDSTRNVLLSVGTQNEASAPLLFSLVRPLGQKHDSGRWWAKTTTRTLASGTIRRYGSFPSPWNPSETAFFCGLDYRAAYWALLAVSKVTARLGDDVVLWACRAVLPLAKLVRRLGTPEGSLRIEAMVDDSAQTVVEVRASRDGLNIPSLPSVWASLALREGPGVSGLVSLSELIDRQAIVDDLRGRGYAVDEVPVPEQRSLGR